MWHVMLTGLMALVQRRNAPPAPPGCSTASNPSPCVPLRQVKRLLRNNKALLEKYEQSLLGEPPLRCVRYGAGSVHS